MLTSALTRARPDHLALTKVLAGVSNLEPSHQVMIWYSSDYKSSMRLCRPRAVRTELATVEDYLFKRLPTWLGAVTEAEVDRAKPKPSPVPMPGRFQPRRSGQTVPSSNQKSPMAVST